MVDVMILKKAGLTSLSNLCTIVLFHPDCNYAFKYVGREMMRAAKTNGTFAPEQYGSRKRRRAIDLAVNNILTNDILCQLKCPGALCSNDAKSCYDLIGHSQVSMAMQFQVVPKPAVDCLFSTLQHATHQVRTGFGDSAIYYGCGCWLIPMHGIGQGNGAGPAIWAVVSTPLLNILRKQGYECEIIDPLNNTRYIFLGYAFMDDTDIIESKTLVLDVDSCMALLQEAMDTWEGTLKATCGAIVPEKTFWYLVDFIWEAGQWRYCSIKECPADLYVKDIHGTRKRIKRYEVWEAMETLGICLSPDGNLTSQATKMLQLATKWSDNMRSGKLSHEDAFLAISSTILQTLSYPLPALHLTRAQCDDIMRPILRWGLPAMGICRSFPRDIVYAPKLYMGLGFKHLHTEQEILHIKDIIFHTHAMTDTGRLYRSTLEILLVELGINIRSPLLTPALVSHLTTPSLIRSTLLFLLPCGILLHS
jgi:hypothetical protein